MIALHDVVIDIVGGVIVLGSLITLVAILEARISNWTRTPNRHMTDDEPGSADLRRHTPND